MGVARERRCAKQRCFGCPPAVGAGIAACHVASSYWWTSWRAGILGIAIAVERAGDRHNRAYLVAGARVGVEKVGKRRAARLAHQIHLLGINLCAQEVVRGCLSDQLID